MAAKKTEMSCAEKTLRHLYRERCRTVSDRLDFIMEHDVELYKSLCYKIIDNAIKKIGPEYARVSTLSIADMIDKYSWEIVQDEYNKIADKVPVEEICEAFEEEL